MPHRAGILVTTYATMARIYRESLKEQEAKAARGDTAKEGNADTHKKDKKEPMNYEKARHPHSCTYNV